MNFTRLTTRSEVFHLVNHHNSFSDMVVLDVETTSVEPRKAVLLDIQLSGKTEDEAFIFSGEFGDLLLHLRKDLPIVAHNYKYDAHVLYRHGIDLLSHTWRDTLLIGHLLDENRESYSLDSYVKEYWNDDYKEKFWGKHKTYEEASEEDQTDYACRDVVYTGRLFRRFREYLSKCEIPLSLVQHVHRLQSSLLRTEICGVSVDIRYLEELGVKLKRRIDELSSEMRSCVKDEVDVLELRMWDKELSSYKTDKGRSKVKRPEFSFESSKQLSTLIYSSLGLPVQKNEKTKKISTDYSSLERIRDYHPIIQLIQENRELQKVYGTYVGGTLDRLDNERIYPNFRVAGTVTGRISHSNPNLAQLPKQGGVRGIYVPDRGRVFISADYSQLEVVIEANLTADKNLIHMLENGESKHDLTARELGCDRDLAKTINFASQYHCSHFKIAKLANCSIDEGLRIWTKYWKVYSGPKRLKDQTDREIDEGLDLVTCYGRRRRFANKKRSPWDSDYRQGYNFKIQSPGSDFMSEAFYLTAEELDRRKYGRGLFTVHDEGIIEVDQDKWEEAQNLLIANMESMGTKYGFKIPLKAEGSGPMERWLD